MENSALVAGLVRLVEDWRSIAALANNQAAANIIEECATGVEDVVDAAMADYGLGEAGNGNAGLEDV